MSLTPKETELYIYSKHIIELKTSKVLPILRHGWPSVQGTVEGRIRSASRARAVALRVLLYGLDQIEWQRPVTKRTESSLTVYQLIF